MMICILKSFFMALMVASTAGFWTIVFMTFIKEKIKK